MQVILYGLQDEAGSFFIYLECSYEIAIFEKPLSLEQKRLSAF
jgi:hypothetical protein